ncbi:Zinc finger transcription factor ace1 [Penicillium rolfsii]|nr:Zinc finger transcription factor ace1 [Penicillium rolfsii]
MVSAQFESTRVHPRRRPVLNTSLAPEAESGSSSKMQLKKGETFNTPTSPPSNESDPVLNIRSLPRRSPTSLDALALSEQRMASILERLTLDDQPEEKSSSAENVDSMHGVNDPNSAVSDASEPSSEDGYDLFPLQKQQQQQQQQQHDHDHDHESDSGLGSSVSSESLPDTAEKVNKIDSRLGQSAIVTAASDFDQGTAPRRQLSYSACKQIERFVLVPILKEAKLKPFHPLVRTIPSRIVNKQIVCLRDLEKILLWLAPKFSASRSSYLSFCEFTIQCLHTSTSHLNSRDQRLPADRPYTNGYFLDLVTQVRRYAAMIQANRQRVQATQDAQAQSAKKEETSSLLATAALEGGLSKNGRPVELVILQDGKLISMATGLPYEVDGPATYKRTIALDEDELDEGVMRSMARRKKNAPPMDINKKCSHCDKVFKRPCDLTKHEKTHSRPWKCTDTTCKYHQIGWPTEKERDRHINDKHADSPVVFRCLFEPCTYSSKRESNCKQHMEKAHGWFYVRSKYSSRALGTKSKRGVSAQAASVQLTPDTLDVSTPASAPTDFSTPSVGPTPSPFEASIDDEDDHMINFADRPDQPPAMGNNNYQAVVPEGYPRFSPSHSAGVNFTDVNQPTGYDNTGLFDPSVGFDTSVSYTNSPGYDNSFGFDNSTGVNSTTGYDNSAYQAPSAGMSNDQVFSHFDNSLASLQAQFAAADPDSLIQPAPADLVAAFHSTSVPSLAETSSIAGSLSLIPSPEVTADTGSDNFHIDWSSLGNMNNMELSSGMEDLAPFQVDGGQCGAYGHVSGLSPGAQGSIMLYSPESGLSGGNISANFPYGLSSAQQALGDFTLFGDAQPQGVNQSQGSFADFD